MTVDVTAGVDHDFTPQVEEMRSKGFTSIGRLLAPDLVAELAGHYDTVLSGEVDCGDDFRMLGGVTRQVMRPAKHYAPLAESGVVEAARRVAAAILGIDDPPFLYDMMIFKPAGHLMETPWHQDLSYYEQPFTPAGRVSPNAFVQVWIAVDDADEENGCMHFVPHVHVEPLRPHYVHSGDPTYEGRLLAMENPEVELDLSTMEPRPLPAGGATFHYENTPHYTPGNRSADRPRRAYIVNFHDPARAGIDA